MRTSIPIKQGKSGKSTGYIDRKPSMVRCDENGTVDVTFRNGGTETVTMVTGEDRMFDHPLPITVEVTGGKFSFA
jgi:hypothetical protein